MFKKHYKTCKILLLSSFWGVKFDGFGDFSFYYGDYDTYGTNFALGYGFACGSYDCGLAYTDFSSDSVDLMDEDAVVFSVSASF